MANFEPTEAQVDNLIGLLDGYAEKGGHHLNVNVLNRETLLDAQAHPENTFYGKLWYGGRTGDKVCYFLSGLSYAVSLLPQS